MRNTFSKIIEMDEFFGNGKTFEPTVTLLNNRSSKVKVASEASEWSASVRSQPGKTYILVLAMGASEYYGPNRNGDAFRETELLKKYKTFETNAHVFRSHVNKDPAKSMGSVVKAFYNSDMHRVELVLELVDSKCPDIVEKIRNGENVAVSMGCRIEFDVCTICGNKAPSRKEYCDHLLNELNEIYPDGRIVAADNPDPNFFDISVVYKPADKTGYMLKKVAADGSRNREIGIASSLIAEKVAARNAISSYLSKAADIDKIVTGVGFSPNNSSSGSEPGKSSKSDNTHLASKWIETIVPKLTKNYVSVDNHDIQALAERDMPRVLSTLSGMGIFLTTPEFLDLIFTKTTGSPAPEGLAEKLIDLQGDIFRLLARHPDIVGDMFSSGVMPGSGEDKDKVVEAKMSSYVPFRSIKSSNVMGLAYTSKTASHISTHVPRPLSADPRIVKLAARALAAYRVHTFDFTKQSGYQQLPLLADGGYSKSFPMPWAAPTIIAVDRAINAKRANSKTASYTSMEEYRDLINLICN